MTAPYVIWDWNGTLLDDTEAVVAALNAMLARRGLPAITLEHYRDIFAFPARDFYGRLGIDVEHEDWDALAREYHDNYEAQPKALNVETMEALETLREMGCGQSILSAHNQAMLDEITRRLGVAKDMEFVCGVDNLDGGSKLDRARELLAAVRTRHFAGIADDELKTRIVLIGDALHDKEVADALGVRCVLCAQGGHSAWRLESAAPTGATLMDALRLALATAEGGNLNSSVESHTEPLRTRRK